MSSIYDLVLIYVCHFHHHFLLLHLIVSQTWGLSRYSCFYLGSCIHEFFWHEICRDHVLVLIYTLCVRYKRNLAMTIKIIFEWFFQPLMWEWIWFGGSFVTYLIGANAIKASKVNKIKLFMLVVNAVGILPLIFGKI